MLPEVGECVALHLEVGLRVASCARDAGMAQVVADDGEIDAGLTQRAGTAVAQYMRRNVLGESRVLGRSASGVFGENIMCAVPRERGVPGAAKYGVGVLGFALGEQRLDGTEGGGPKWAKTLLPALAEEPHLIRWGELKIGPMHRDGFADASARVVEEKQQRVVTLSARGTTIRLCQQMPHLVGLQIARRGRSAPLGRQRQDSRVLVRMDRVVTQGVLKEGAESDATAVARGDAITAYVFERLQERSDNVGLKIDEPKSTDRHAATIRREQQKEHHRIAIRRDGVGARAAHFLQMVAEERLDQGEQGVGGLHAAEVPNWNCRRSRRLAMASNSGVVRR